MTKEQNSKATAKGRRQFLDTSWKAISGVVAGGLLQASAGALAQPAGRKILILYYSRTGHTRVVASQIHGLTGGESLEIETVAPYPADYDALVAQNVEEQRSGCMPPLRTAIDTRN